jgi:hypothetical protein
MLEYLTIAGGAALLGVGALAGRKPAQPAAAALPATARASAAISAALTSAAPIVKTFTSAAGGAGNAVFSLTSPPREVSGVKMSLPAGKVGIWIKGGGHRIVNVGFTGGDKGIFLDGASGVTVDGFTHADPHGYGLYLAGGCDGVTLKRLAISLVRDGMHCVRIYGTRNLIIDGAQLVQRVSYGGTTLALKQCAGFELRGLATAGDAPSIGPLDLPAELGYRVTDGLIEDCHFRIEATIGMMIGSGCSNLFFRRCTFEQTTRAEILKVRSSWLSRPAPFNVRFERCAFDGGGVPFGGDASPLKFLQGNTRNGAAL